MTWLKNNPPKEINDYFERVYPEINTIEENIRIIEKCGYKLLGHFSLQEDAWWEFYYNPLEERLKKLTKKYKNNQKALEMIYKEKEEIEFYRKYNQWYGSVFYVMQK